LRPSSTLSAAIIKVKAASDSVVAHFTENIVPARLTLISHAATSSQRRSAFPVDEPLEGSELSKLAAFNWPIPRVQQMLTGPELRTRQTAEALHLSATPTNALRDCDYATWQGRDLNDLYAESPEAVTQWLNDSNAAPHDGESISDLILRVARWLEAVAAEAAGASVHTLAVTHPAIIRAAILHTFDAPLKSFWRADIAPLTLTDLRHNGRSWTLRSSSVPLSLHQPDEA
jgi:broad specificity phosphatase PhoE